MIRRASIVVAVAAVFLAAWMPSRAAEPPVASQPQARTASSAPSKPARESRREKRERLGREVSSLSKAGKYEAALESAKKLEKLYPRDGRIDFNIAGLLARLMRHDEALARLDVAVKRHAVVPELLAADNDLDAIRGDSRFIEMAQRAADDFNGAQIKDDIVWTMRFPANYDKWRETPLIVALHGFGSKPEHMQMMWSATADEFGAILVTPRGSKEAAEGYYWATRSGTSRTVMSVLKDLRRRVEIDMERTALTGFSQGGGMTYGVALDYPRSFRGFIPMASAFAWYNDDALTAGNLKGMRMMIIHGSLEPDAIRTYSELARTSFLSAGAMVEHKIIDGVGHYLPPDPKPLLREALEFVWRVE